MDYGRLIELLILLAGGMLIGRFGFMRNITAIVDSRITQNTTAAQIALKREESDLETVHSLRDQLSSLSELLRTQLMQQAQAATVNSASQDKLSSNIREVLDVLLNNQRTATHNVEELIRAYGRDMDEFKAVARREINTLDIAFRSISDGFIYQNSLLTKTLTKVDTSLDDIRDMVQAARSDVAVIKANSQHDQENLDDVVEIVTHLRNTVVRYAGAENETPLIATPDSQEPPVPLELPVVSEPIILDSALRQEETVVHDNQNS